MLPDDRRHLFKDPLGPVVTDPAAVAADATGTLVTVGDIVTYEFETAGYAPSVAVIDGTTGREPVAPAVADVLSTRTNRLTAPNPPGTITAALVQTLKQAFTRQPPVTVAVDGEEDLATLPAVLHAPLDATVVYGQPGEGMVALAVTESLKTQCRELLSRFEGDHDRICCLFAE